MAEPYYPSAEDIAFWDKYDATYGTDYAGQLKPGAKGKTIPTEEIMKFYGIKDYDKLPVEEKMAKIKELESKIQEAPMDKESRDKLMRTYIASQRSGIASLGFNPGNIVLSKEKEGVLKNLAGLNVGGKAYEIRDPSMDPSTLTHESMHQGIKNVFIGHEKTEKNNKNFDDWDKYLSERRTLNRAFQEDNEDTTRALMQKYYGDIESQTKFADKAEVESGKNFLMGNLDFLDDLEQLATEELRRRGRPMGPR